MDTQTAFLSLGRRARCGPPSRPAARRKQASRRETVFYLQIQLLFVPYFLLSSRCPSATKADTHIIHRLAHNQEQPWRGG